MTSSSQAKPSSSRASVTSKVHLSRQLSKKSSEKENNVALLYKTPTFNSQVQSTRKKRGIMLIGTPGCGKTNKKQKMANIFRLQVEETMSNDALESKSSSVLDCYRTVDHSSDETNFPNQSLFSQLDSGSKGFYSWSKYFYIFCKTELTCVKFTIKFVVIYRRLTCVQIPKEQKVLLAAKFVE